MTIDQLMTIQLLLGAAQSLVVAGFGLALWRYAREMRRAQESTTEPPEEQK